MIKFIIEAENAEEFAQVLSIIRGEETKPVERLPFSEIFRNNIVNQHKPVPTAADLGGVIENPALAIIGDDPARQETVTPEVITKVENGVEQVITMFPNSPAPEKKTRRTKAQIEAERVRAEVEAMANSGNAIGYTESDLAKAELPPVDVNSPEYLAAQAEITANIVKAEEPKATLPTVKPTTLDDIRALCYPINKLGDTGKQAIKSLLGDAGFTALGQIPEAEYNDYADKIRAIAKSLKVEYV